MPVYPRDAVFNGFGAGIVRFLNPGPGFSIARSIRSILGSDQGVDILSIDTDVTVDQGYAAGLGEMYMSHVAVFRTTQTLAANDCPDVILPSGFSEPSRQPAGVELLFIARYTIKNENPTAALNIGAAALRSPGSWRFDPGVLRAGQGQRLFVTTHEPINNVAGFGFISYVNLTVGGIDYGVLPREQTRGFASLPRFAVGLGE